MLLLFILFCSFLFILLFVHSLIYVPPPRQVHLPIQKGEKVAVVIGATGSVGIELVNRFLSEGYTVIASSRKEGRWRVVVKEQNWEKVMNSTLFWRPVDVRVSRKVEDLFQEISSIYPTIDVAANAFMIQETGSVPSTIVEGDSILIRLPSAYNQPNNLGLNMNQENSFFTNFIGLWNTIQVEKKYNVKRIMNPKQVSPTTDALVTSFSDPSFTDLYLGEKMV